MQANVSISYLESESDGFDELLDLYRANKKTLGFLPDGAFLEALRSRHILVATDGSGALAGYLLFRVVGQSATITHLCVNSQMRKSGIGRSLVEVLIEDSSGTLYGVRANTRQDYPVSRIWESMGFAVIDEKPGRGSDMMPVLTWRLSHEQLDLFDQIPATKPIAVLDTNIVIEIQDNASEDSVGLIEPWINDHLKFAITEHFRTDIAKNLDAPKRKSRIQWATETFGIVGKSTSANRKIADKLEASIENSPGTVDLSHLAAAIAAEAKFFVTKDRNLITRLKPVAASYGVAIVEPADLISASDDILGRGQYQPARLAGTDMAIEKLGDTANIDDLCARFANNAGGETNANFRGILRQVLSSPDKYSVRTIVDNSQSGIERVKALFATQLTPKRVEVNLFRTENSSTGNLVADQISITLSEAATENKCYVTRVSDRFMREGTTRSLIEAGFSPTGYEFSKISIPGVWDRESLADEISKLSPNHDGPSTSAVTLLTSHLRSDMMSSLTQKTAEHLLWPVIIEDGIMPWWIVPIRPEWAAQLFDTRTAAASMFGSSPQSMLRRSNVYYRSATNPLRTTPARILWYVSEGTGNYPYRKGIAATSILDETHVLPASAAFSRFKDFGVFSQEAIQNTANKTGEVNVLQFSRNLVLPKNVPFSGISEILRKSNVSSNNFVAPYRVDSAIGLKILKVGGI